MATVSDPVERQKNKGFATGVGWVKIYSTTRRRVPKIDAET